MPKNDARVLMISTDRNAFNEEHEAADRMRAYGALFGALDVIIYTPRGFREKTLEGGVRLYPTNSARRILAPSHAFRLAKAIIAREHPTVVTTQDAAECGIVGRRIKKQFGLSLHVQIHTDLFSPWYKRESIKNRVRVFMALRTLHAADRIRVVSERIRDSLSRRGISAGKIDLLPIRVDPEEFTRVKRLSSSHHESSFIILMVARLEREKRLTDALDAFVLVKKIVPQARLRIIGDGSLRRDLLRNASQRGLRDALELPGWIDRARGEEYHRASCYLLTSAYEGYGRSVIEAALSQTPIVMTNVGVAGELIKNGESGFVVPVGDPPAIAQSLLLVYASPEEARRRAEQAQRTVLASIPSEEEYLRRYSESLTS